MSTKLKIKLKTLAAEASFIRREERNELRYKRYRKDPDRHVYNDLRNHRIGLGRKEARDTQLAYAFLRGKSLYKEIEANPRVEPDWANIRRMVESYAAPNTDKKELVTSLEAWKLESADI